MVTLDATICEVMVTRTGRERELRVELMDGRRIAVPLDWFPALSLASPAQAEDYEVADDGLSVMWPDLCETVTVAFLLAHRMPPAVAIHAGPFVAVQ